MKRILLAVIALLSLVAGYAHLQQKLPATVSQYLEENAISQRLSKVNGAQALAEFVPTFAAPRMVNGTEMIEAFIEYSDQSVIESLKAEGVIISCEFDGFVTAQIPTNRLTMISQMSGVVNVEIAKVMEACTDQTLAVTRAGEVLNGPDYGLPQVYDGTGIIMGIIDSGFDYQHYAFRDANDNNRNRIVRVYDTTNSSGHPALVGTTTLAGSVFMGEQIDTLTTDCDGSHGTHTASIAAGIHYNGYGGMAPGCDIVMCVSTKQTDVEYANCMKYIYAYADSVGKPCVISLSMSIYNGDHDGKSYLARAVAQQVGPGRIFVIAAGNNAGGFNGNYKYVYGAPTMKNPFIVKFVNRRLEVPETNYSMYYGSFWGELWCHETYTIPVMQFHIVDRQTRQIVWKSGYLNEVTTINSSEFSDFYEPDPWVDSIGYMSISYIAVNASTMKNYVRFGLYNLRSKAYTVNEYGVYDSRYQIGLTIYPPAIVKPTLSYLKDSCNVDIWVSTGERYFGYDETPIYVESVWVEGDSVHREDIESYYAIPSDKCSINTHAVNDSLISAGNFAAHNSHYSLTRDSIIPDPTVTIGDICINSSYEEAGYGPSGKALPTVCAPGVYVVAAGNRYSYFNSGDPLGNPDLVMRGPDRSLWGVMTGTSMAAPTVAGIIAQWLQINPNLSPSDVKNIIAKTAIKDNFTDSPRFGPNGKIDAMAGVRYLLGMSDDVLLGDVDGDGEVTIKDVTSMIDLLLGNDVDVPDERVLDVDQDGEFSIKDVTSLIDILLN